MCHAPMLARLDVLGGENVEGEDVGLVAGVLGGGGGADHVGDGLVGEALQWVGDDQWVFDGWTNGWAAVVHVQTNYGKDRYCQALPSADGWGTCNYDHEEGKCVRFRLYELKDGLVRNMSDFSRWYGTEYGSPC